jgi:hypothetical protein
VRRAIVLLVVAALAAGTTAVAQDGGDAPAPVVRSGSVLHLQGDRSCHGTHGVTIRVTPPADVALGWVRIRVDGRQVVRLTGVASSASVTVRLHRTGGRVAVAGETLDGQQVSRARRYRSCIDTKPTPAQPRRGRPPVIVGGGEA